MLYEVITINQAFSNASEIDFDLAAAGEARQIVDLLWGASLTRFISLAARRGGNNILSVGRVQSPTLAMIVDREREIEAFRITSYNVCYTKLLRFDMLPRMNLRDTPGRYTQSAEALPS